MFREKIREMERILNDRIVDFIIGGSYLGDFRPHLFEKTKSIGLEAYAHILIQWERLKERYRE